MSLEEEISEIIQYVTEMKRSFNRKLDDHLFIMEQQNQRIEKQCQQINEQKEIIDELAWQIRDLRDAIRCVKENQINCVCNYENHSFELDIKKQQHQKYQSEIRNSSSSLQNYRIEEEDEEDEEGIYETVEQIKRTTYVAPTQNINRANLINRTSQVINNNFQSTDPPPPPPSASSSLAIIENALEKLAKIQLTSTIERDSIDQDLTDEDVLFRTKSFRKFSSNSQRGSSKVACSLILDIDQEYIPNDDELDNNNNSNKIDV